MAQKRKGVGFFTYLREAQQELKKVTWPTREDLIKNTIAVIVVSLIVAAFLGGLDYLFNEGLFWVLSR
ncbi:MAG: preprotein translocase subunit SecE [Candidatus Jacksonbacteria bacterium]|mgnify:FL=1|jgi:preprotein translocase subunit SecE|nr:preprotein translocase subunit SecE [Candidatus Jacksonbacteria bacterium]MBT6757394.1 preprotein translocase subunit SecE [Candidatus Jacksonbacteria bacterium]MBT7008585.1 preprotein translocase subunit SecE [Candidatus Jacksonbacteria bacterium]MBT7338666.1 preprotein translocase subunit SecE [Candidatus Jacksonbacteria bacterium]